MREKIAIDYAMKGVKKQDVFHSSGYAQAQNGGNMGAAAGDAASFAARQAMEQHRKYVRGYKNARIVNQYYGAQRAKTYVPPSQRGDGAETTAERFGRNRQSVGEPEDNRCGLRASRASQEQTKPETNRNAAAGQAVASEA